MNPMKLRVNIVENAGGQEEKETHDFGHVLRLVILKFNMQTVLNSDLHLDCIICVWGHAVGVHPEIAFLHDLAYPP